MIHEYIYVVAIAAAAVAFCGLLIVAIVAMYFGKPFRARITRRCGPVDDVELTLDVEANGCSADSVPMECRPPLQSNALDSLCSTGREPLPYVGRR